MSIVLENSIFKLTLNDNAITESLILKSNGEELIMKDCELPFFSVTIERPFNNEMKLAHPNKQTILDVRRLQYENGKLTVSYDMLEASAVIDVKIAERYIAFTLDNFVVFPEDIGVGLEGIDPDEVYETRLVRPIIGLRLAQLPIKPREHFGEWLNVMWDEKAAVNILACDPYPRIDSEARKDHRILYGEALRDVKLKGTTVGLIVSEKDKLLDAINDIEYDFDLPKGVESRRSGLLNRSYYQNGSIFPSNVDEHIAFIKKAGIKNVVLYYPCVSNDVPGLNYSRCGEYDIREEYENGLDSLREMVKKMNEAGLTVGYHFLHTHIGLHTSYITPTADYRLNTTKKFRLAKPILADDTEIFVEEDPTGSPTTEKYSILMFMGELISSDGYTTERPYKF